MAIVISVNEMNSLAPDRRGFSETYRRFREDHDLTSLDIDPTDVFGSTADRSLGKDFSWQIEDNSST